MRNNKTTDISATPRFSVGGRTSPFIHLQRGNTKDLFPIIEGVSDRTGEAIQSKSHKKCSHISVEGRTSPFIHLQRGNTNEIPLQRGNRRVIIPLLSFLFLFIFNNAFSKDYTPYSLEFGAGLNINAYFSDFQEFNGFPNCCNKFDYAEGIGYYFYAGAAKKINLFNNRSKFGINLELNNFSANYLINEYIGNDIRGNTYRRIYVDNKLDVNWLVAGINPYFEFKFFNNMPLDIKVGFNFGIPLTKSFTQQELISEPSDINFANGSKINYDYSGDLPDANSTYLGASIGVKYKITDVSGFDISPELSFIYGFTPPVKDYAWNNLAIRAGISITYNIPVKEEERLEAPPIIEPKAPPTPEPPAAPIVSIKVMDNEQTYNNRDTITAIFKIDYYNYLLSYIPILFFDNNQIKAKSSMNIIEENSDMNFFEIIRKTNFADNYGEIVAEYAQKNNLKIEVIGQSPDEDFELVKQRLDDIRNNLISNGIDKDNIKYDIKKIDKIKDDRPQIINELRKVTFKFSNNADLITSTIVKDKIDYKFNKSLGYMPNVESEFDKIEFQSYSQFNNGDKNPLGYKLNDILLTASLFENVGNKPNELTIIAEAKDSLGQKGSDKFTLYLQNKKEINNNFYNITDNQNSALILGYFNFDSFNFSAIDNNVLNYVKEKIIDKNYIIEIIPSTDNLGTPEYNQNLAERRAKSTTNLLSLKNNNLPDNVSINYPQNELFNNETPYGRYLNRTVVIKIRKK